MRTGVTLAVSRVTLDTRDSKPGAFLPNPGFGFGKPPNPGFGSGSGLGRWRLYTRKIVSEIRHLWLIIAVK